MMKDYDVKLNPEFLLVLSQKMSKKANGKCAELVEFLKVVNEYNDLCELNEKQSEAYIKRIRNEYGIFSDELLAQITAIGLTGTVDGYDVDSYDTMEEFSTLLDLFHSGEIAKTELIEVYKKAHDLKKKLVYFKQIMPQVCKKYGFPKEVKKRFNHEINNMLKFVQELCIQSMM